MMNTSYYNNKVVNKVFKSIFFKKQYRIRLRNKIDLLDTVIKNDYKSLNFLSQASTARHFKEFSKISYIIRFSFSRTNTRLHIVDCSGKTRFFYSAGLLQFSGKQKRFQWHIVLNKFYKILFNDLPFLKFSPIIVIFKNKDSRKRVRWFLKKLQKKFHVVGFQFLYSYPYNGCRLKKLKRKKFRTKQKK